jgi:hypothetical protein
MLLEGSPRNEWFRPTARGALATSVYPIAASSYAFASCTGQFNVAQYSYDAVRQGGGQAHYDYTVASASLPGGAVYQVEQVNAFQQQARAPQQWS